MSPETPERIGPSSAPRVSPETPEGSGPSSAPPVSPEAHETPERFGPSSAPPVSPETPERFGPFVLLRQLGAGGMGTAHLALHAPSGEAGALFVVKRLHPELLREPTMLERFVHEAEVATHVRHHNVAQLVAMGRVKEEPFLATEFVFGVQLSRVVDRIEEGVTAAAPLAPALHLGWQLARGVRAIHEAVHRETGAPLGLLHRDVGARNVLVGYDGRARIIDLGLGKSILSDWQTSHEVLAGSPDYMPPEQAMGARVDARADVHALAVTVWELLAGRRRIREDTIAKRIERCIGAQPEPLRAYRPDASERLEALLMEAMEPDPSRRLPAAVLLEEGLQAELRELSGGRSRADALGSEAGVSAWLDVACAALRARETRALEADRARGLASIDGEGEVTRMYVGDVGAYVRSAEHPLEALEAPVRAPMPADEKGPTRVGSEGLLAKPRPPAPGAARRHAAAPSRSALDELLAPLRALPRPTRWLLGSLLVSVAILAAVVTAILTAPPEPVRLVELPSPEAPGSTASPSAPVQEAPPEPSAPRPEPSAPRPEPPAEARAPEPTAPAKRPPPRVLSPADEARRRQLVRRIRQLRRRSFEIGFQREVTRLSARVSRARSSAALDALERRIERLEDRT